jgi:hypothetical protein
VQAAGVISGIVAVLQAGQVIPSLAPALAPLDCLLGCLEPLITKVGIQLAGKQAAGFGGKALLRAALAALLGLTALTAAQQWAAAWQQLGGSFWLSRLSRDVEAGVRCGALALLAALVQPGAEATQHMVVQVGGAGAAECCRACLMCRMESVRPCC